jgi:hypothetical protein
VNTVYSGWAQEDWGQSFVHVVADSVAEADHVALVHYEAFDANTLISWDRKEETNQLTIGQILDFLEVVENQEQLVRFQYDNEIRYLDGDFDSSRGSYVNLAIGWQLKPNYLTVAALIDTLTYISQNLLVFEGYKGGQYRMSRKTLVDIGWNYHATGLGVVGVEEKNGVVYLIAGEI